MLHCLLNAYHYMRKNYIKTTGKGAEIYFLPLFYIMGNIKISVFFKSLHNINIFFWEL